MPGVFSIFQKSSIGSKFHLSKITTNGCLLLGISPANVRFQSEGTIYAEEYQYLMKSIVPTTHFQDSLPHLPIPKLDETCKRYLRAQRPLLDPEAYKQTESYVEDFLKKEGVQCQNVLVQEDKINKHTSYISKPWFDMYLSDRNPLPINVNPFLVFVRNTDELYNSQLVKASNLVISSLRFYKSLQEEILEPEIYHLNPDKSKTLFFKKFTGLLPRSISWYGAYLFKAFPLDMSQYPSLFSTTRVPQVGKDCIKHVNGKRHILIMKKGHFYVFDVLDTNGNIVPPDVIVGGLQSILTSTESEAKHPVGILTTENRDVWAAARKHLVSLGNSEVLELIDTSLFNLVLDDSNPGNDPVRLIRLFLHADGINRWFDKSFSLIVTQDGYAGINFEHSWGDGVAVLRYFNDIYNDSTTKPRVHHDTLGKNTSTVRKLEFNLDDKMKNIIDEAKKKYNKTCNSLEVRVMEYTKFGRQVCKPLNISPDAMMQLSFQMAYNKLKGKPVATYESCSTAAFKHGRTETVRPCTIETQELCQTLTQVTPAPSKDQLQQIIKKCSVIHSQLIKEAAMGQGFDRHLFALKLKCDEIGLKPALYSDPAYRAINHNILSTSTLSSDSLYMGAFGPVVRDGFGIGYSVWKDRLGTIVTNYSGCSDGEGLIQALEHSLDKIDFILKP